MKVRANSTYFYDPVMMDQLDPPFANPLRGVRLTVKNLPGCPPCGTMGMCHVNFAETDVFAGLVSVHSLTKDDPTNNPDALTQHRLEHGKPPQLNYYTVTHVWGNSEDTIYAFKTDAELPTSSVGGFGEKDPAISPLFQKLIHELAIDFEPEREESLELASMDPCLEMQFTKEQLV